MYYYSLFWLKMILKENDKKLLISLFYDSSKSNKQLAQKISVTKETVATRIKYLENNNLIKSFSLKINYELLGFEEFNLFLRLKNIDDKNLNDLILFLANHNNVTWVGKSFGKYDLKIALILKKNSKQINNIICEITSKFYYIIDLIDYLYVIDKFKASSDLFLQNLLDMNKKEFLIQNTNKIVKKHKKISTKKNIISLNIDNKDKKIIYLVGQKPKITYVELGSELGFTAEGIKYKIRKLISNDIIKGYSIVFDGNKFNKVWCLVLLNINPNSINDFKFYLQRQIFLSNYVETMGIWNFNITFFAKNIEELYKSLNQIRNKFSLQIRNFEFLIFFDFYKYPQIPKCILE